MKKKGMWAVISVGVYLAVLKLLVYAESFSPESSIRSLKDALWYSWLPSPPWGMATTSR